MSTNDITIPLQTVVAEDDAALVAAAKTGRNQAFEVLFRRYQARILNVVVRFTRNREDAEDIAQQSFQKAFVHLQQFEGISSFSTWMTRIAMNEALMWLRRKRASREVSIEDSSTDNETVLLADFLDLGPSPEDGCLGRERQRILSRAMNELTPAQRVAIEVRELDELSTGEAAGAMGISVTAVKARVFQGRKRLRAVLKRYFEPARRDSSQPHTRRPQLEQERSEARIETAFSCRKWHDDRARCGRRTEGDRGGAGQRQKWL